MQGITDQMETSLAEAEQTKQDQAEERRASARHEREQAELGAQQEEAAEHERGSCRAPHPRGRPCRALRRRRGRLDGQRERAPNYPGRQREHPACRDGIGVTAHHWVSVLGYVARDGRVAAEPADPEPQCEYLVHKPGDQGHVREGAGNPARREMLTVGTRKVSTGTTHIRRYVVETPVEKQVSLVRERVVVERRRPVTDKISGEMLTECTVEVAETDESRSWARPYA